MSPRRSNPWGARYKRCSAHVASDPNDRVACCARRGPSLLARGSVCGKLYAMVVQTLRRLAAVCLPALLVTSPGLARAQDAEPAPTYLPGSDDEAPQEAGVESHDGGMIRLTLGFGAGSVSQDYSNVTGLEVELSGGGLVWSADVGAGVTERLTVHARIGQLWLTAPRFSARNAAPGSPESQPLASGSTLTATLVGAGASYNFMPLNMYLTAIGGLSVIYLELGDADEDDQEILRTGVGFNFDVGKEWWVASQLGLGVAARFWWATGGADYRGAHFDRTLLGLGLVLSSTYQ
jgi:hypothetical protein